MELPMQVFFRTTPLLNVLAYLLATLMLTACGGGGSGGTSNNTSTVTTAEGVYVGTISNGLSFDALVLENDTYYVLYGTPAGGSLYVQGFATGSGISNNGNFTSSNLKDYLYTGTVTNGSLTATYTAGSSFNGSTSTNTFTGAPPTSTSYVYSTAPNLGSITGAWSLTDMFGASVTANIASTGAFTTSSSGCLSTGTLTPRASGKNVFDLSVTFGAAPCVLANQTASGIAVSYLLSNGTRQLILAGTNSSNTVGTAVFGTR
jgi:hypothetical protein